MAKRTAKKEVVEKIVQEASIEEVKEFKQSVMTLISCPVRLAPCLESSCILRYSKPGETFLVEKEVKSVQGSFYLTTDKTYVSKNDVCFS